MIGIDAISIDRIQRTCDRFQKTFLLRFLSHSELALCLKSDHRLNYQRIAGFWAAKEAISKALGTGIGEKLSFLDIILSKDSNHAPQATLKTDKKEIFKIKDIAISITHDQNLAIAVAYLQQENTNIQTPPKAKE